MKNIHEILEMEKNRKIQNRKGIINDFQYVDLMERKALPEKPIG